MRFMAKSATPKVGDLRCKVERSMLTKLNDGREQLKLLTATDIEDENLKTWAAAQKRVSLSIQRLSQTDSGETKWALVEHRQCKGNEALALMAKVYDGRWAEEQAQDIADTRRKKHGQQDAVERLAEIMAGKMAGASQ